MVTVVMVTNQVVAVALNHVMTVVATKAVMIVVVLAATARLVIAHLAAKVVLKTAATVIQHRVKQTATQPVMHQDQNLTVQKDQLATAHVASATVALLVTAVHLAIVAVVQMQARQTAVSVTAQHSVKSLTHVTANLVTVSVAKAVQIVAQCQLQRVVTTTVTKAVAMHHAVLPVLVLMQVAVLHVVHVVLLK